MWDRLPSEIATDILTRLPVKTLIRCTSLSKYFHSFITSKQFTTTHLAKSKTNHLLLLRCAFREDDEKSRNKELMFFEPDDENFSGFHDGVVVPVKDHAGGLLTVLGSINGVICLCNDFGWEGSDYYMWNPCVRKCVTLPKPQFVFYSIGPFESGSGFGFDSLSGDYKVVRLVDVGAELAKFTAEVYSFNSGCWKTLDDAPRYLVRTGSYFEAYVPCFLRGSVHWVAYNYREVVILRFDVSSEVFDVIEVPSSCKKYGKCIGVPLYVQECRGELALMEMGLKENPPKCCIWLMREYGVAESWTKYFDFKTSSLAAGMPMPVTFGFRDNGEIIAVKRDSRDYAYKWNAKLEISEIDLARDGQPEKVIDILSGISNSLYMSTYVESLALINEGKGVSEER